MKGFLLQIFIQIESDLHIQSSIILDNLADKCTLLQSVIKNWGNN